MITVSDTFSGIGRSGTAELKESREPAKEAGGFQNFLDKLRQKDALPEEAREKAAKSEPDKEKKPVKESQGKEKPVQEKTPGEKTGKEVSGTVEQKRESGTENGKEGIEASGNRNPDKKSNPLVKKLLPEKKTISAKDDKKSLSAGASDKEEQVRAGEMTAQMNAQIRHTEAGAEKAENMKAAEEGKAGDKEFSLRNPENSAARSLKDEGPATLHITDLRKSVKSGRGKAENDQKRQVKKSGENGKSAERDLRLAGEEKQGNRTGDLRKAFGAEEKRTGRVEVSQNGPEEKGDPKTIHVNLTSADEAAGKGKSGEPAQAARQLSSRLQEDLSAKIVKHASIVVKSERSGEIKLILHPENLGRVRIQLQLEDNRIAGRIFVDNTSVREAFEGNLKNLERAFQQDGFDSAKLEVFVGDREQDQRRAGSDKHPAGFNGPEKAVAVDKLGMSVPSMERYYADGDTLIDLVV